MKYKNRIRKHIKLCSGESMENGGQAMIVETGQMFPVFHGLEIAKIPGKKMASIVGVAPATYSKWRTGKSRIPATTMVFLTLLLANRIDELRETGPDEGLKSLRFEATLKSILRHLRHQEAINNALQPGIVRHGAHLFRQWWQKSNNEAVVGLGAGQFSALSHAMNCPNVDRLDVAS